MDQTEGLDRDRGTDRLDHTAPGDHAAVSDDRHGDDGVDRRPEVLTMVDGFTR